MLFCGARQIEDTSEANRPEKVALHLSWSNISYDCDSVLLFLDSESVRKYFNKCLVIAILFHLPPVGDAISWRQVALGLSGSAEIQVG